MATNFGRVAFGNGCRESHGWAADFQVFDKRLTGMMILDVANLHCCRRRRRRRHSLLEIGDGFEMLLLAGGEVFIHLFANIIYNQTATSRNYGRTRGAT